MANVEESSWYMMNIQEMALNTVYECFAQDYVQISLRIVGEENNQSLLIPQTFIKALDAGIKRLG